VRRRGIPSPIYQDQGTQTEEIRNQGNLILRLLTIIGIYYFLSSLPGAHASPLQDEPVLSTREKLGLGIFLWTTGLATILLVIFLRRPRIRYALPGIRGGAGSMTAEGLGQTDGQKPTQSCKCTTFKCRGSRCGCRKQGMVCPTAFKCPGDCKNKGEQCPMPECSFWGPSVHALSRHLSDTHPTDKASCPYCSTQKTCHEAALAHMVNCPRQQKNPICPYCQAIMDHASQLFVHVETEHDNLTRPNTPETRICPECVIGFKAGLLYS
jgi:hypothetical protein